MPGTRRVALAAEADRRLQERKGRIGGDVKSMRRRRSLTQGQLADRIGVNRLVITRIERGIGRVDVEALAVPEAVGQFQDVGHRRSYSLRLHLASWETRQ